MVDGVGLAVVAGQDRDVSIGRLPAHRSDDGGELRPAHGLTGVVVDRRDRGGGQRGGDTTGGAGVGSLPHPPQCTCISTPALRSRGGHDNRSRPLDRQPSPATRLYADYLHEEVGALDSDYVWHCCIERSAHPIRSLRLSRSPPPSHQMPGFTVFKVPKSHFLLALRHHQGALRLNATVPTPAWSRSSAASRCSPG